ncbi:MAG: hypothetical protein IID44_25130 [Planctomycetes bacterium]|nr:hypothetical protein [Planctomycetota bacterium]
MLTNQVLSLAIVLSMTGCAEQMNRPRSKEAFVKEYTTAFDRGDTERVLSLVDWNGVPKPLRELYERLLTLHAGKHKVSDARLVKYKPDPKINDTYRGRKVITNSKPSYWFEVTTKGNLGFEGGSSENTLKFPVGEADGKFFFCGAIWADDDGSTGK